MSHKLTRILDVLQYVLSIYGILGGKDIKVLQKPSCTDLM